MKRKGIEVVVFVGVFLSVLVALGIAAQDKYTLSFPKGLAFSDFRGGTRTGRLWPSVRLKIC